MLIKEKIIKIIEENGVEISNDGTLENIDSISFVSVLVSIEQEFDVEIPDEFLTSDRIPDVESLAAVVELELSKVSAQYN